MSFTWTFKWIFVFVSAPFVLAHIGGIIYLSNLPSTYHLFLSFKLSEEEFDFP